jgi:hypothetical protein
MAPFAARECGRKPLPQLSTPCVPRRCYSGRRCEVFEADNHCQRRSWLAPPPRGPRCSAAAMCFVRAVPRSISFCYLPGLLSGREAARRVSLQGDWQDTCIHVGCGHVTWLICHKRIDCVRLHFPSIHVSLIYYSAHRMLPMLCHPSPQVGRPIRHPPTGGPGDPPSASIWALNSIISSSFLVPFVFFNSHTSISLNSCYERRWRREHNRR